MNDRRRLNIAVVALVEMLTVLLPCRVWSQPGGTGVASVLPGFFLHPNVPFLGFKLESQSLSASRSDSGILVENVGQQGTQFVFGEAISGDFECQLQCKPNFPISADKVKAVVHCGGKSISLPAVPNVDGSDIRFQLRRRGDNVRIAHGNASLGFSVGVLQAVLIAVEVNEPVSFTARLMIENGRTVELPTGNVSDVSFEAYKLVGKLSFNQYLAVDLPVKEGELKLQETPLDKFYLPMPEVTSFHMLFSISLDPSQYERPAEPPFLLEAGDSKNSKSNALPFNAADKTPIRLEVLHIDNQLSIVSLDGRTHEFRGCPSIAMSKVQGGVSIQSIQVAVPDVQSLSKEASDSIPRIAADGSFRAIAGRSIFSLIVKPRFLSPPRTLTDIRYVFKDTLAGYSPSDNSVYLISLDQAGAPEHYPLLESRGPWACSKNWFVDGRKDYGVVRRRKRSRNAVADSVYVGPHNISALGIVEESENQFLLVSTKRGISVFDLETLAPFSIPADSNHFHLANAEYLLGSTRGAYGLWRYQSPGQEILLSGSKQRLLAPPNTTSPPESAYRECRMLVCAVRQGTGLYQKSPTRNEDSLELGSVDSNEVIKITLSRNDRNIFTVYDYQRDGRNLDYASAKRVTICNSRDSREELFGSDVKAYIYSGLNRQLFVEFANSPRIAFYDLTALADQ